MAHVYVDSNAVGAGTGADWTNAYTTLLAAFNAKAAGDNFWLAHNHAETAGAALALAVKGTSSSPCTVICVNSAGSVPAVAADVRDTATITTTGAFGLTISNATSGGCTYFYGITFSAGTGATNAQLNLNNGRNLHIFENCKLKKLGTVANAAAIQANNIGSAVNGGVTLINTQLFFGTSGDLLSVGDSVFRWLNTPVGIGSVTIPTTLFRGYNRFHDVIVTGVGLAEMAGGTLVGGGWDTSGDIQFENCSVASNTVVAVPPILAGGTSVRFVNSDSAGTNYRHEKHSYEGSQVVDTALIRTGGASNGTTGISWKITGTANNKWTSPFRTYKVATWNDTTAANVTVTIEGLQDPRTSTALPTNADVWMELNYMGSAASPLATNNNGGKANFLTVGTNLTASTQAWDSLITARANTTVYALGDRIKVATNSGRVFICTTAGTSAGSEPAGYATAIDGGSVTDNTATFTAAVRFKQSITLSAPQPAQKGPIYATIKVAKASGIYYIDPKLVLS